jgi:hypothetical protein
MQIRAVTNLDMALKYGVTNLLKIIPCIIEFSK